MKDQSITLTGCCCCEFSWGLPPFTAVSFPSYFCPPFFALGFATFFPLVNLLAHRIQSLVLLSLFPSFLLTLSLSPPLDKAGLSPPPLDPLIFGLLPSAASSLSRSTLSALFVVCFGFRFRILEFD